MPICYNDQVSFPLVGYLLNRLFPALIIGALLSACLAPPVTPNSPSPSVPAVNRCALYFTNPHSPTADAYQGGPDEPLAESISAARVSVDLAIYDLNLASIRDALLNAYQRGVAVRMVTESDNLDEAEIQEIKAAGIPVLGDRREGLMHNKFVVIDRSQVWTGSMNFTTNDAYRNNNNFICFDSTKLAEDYTVEFEEMFVDDHFGPDAVAQTPYPQLTIGDVLLEVFFSPDDGTAARIIELLNRASQSIYFLAYSFTSNDIAGAMLARAQEGVTVAGVFEEAQVESNIGSEYDHLLSAGLDVRLDGNPRNMHHKVILIDGQIVITGSYNFSRNAEERNDENTLIIHDPQIAARFMEEFQRVYAEGQQP